MMSANRMLSIILLLSNKGLVTGKELAEHVDVSVRTIYRDIDKICQAGIPISAIGGKSGGFYIMENYKLNDLHFNKDEFNALSTILDSLDIVFGKEKQFNDILLKLKSTFENENTKKNNNLNIDMSHFSMEQELKDFLYIISKSIRENKVLEFEYINRNLESEKRIVEPLKIEFSEGNWYLIGYCRKRNDYRKFKLVRIQNLNLGSGFEKKEISEGMLKEIFSKSYEEKNIKLQLKFSNRIGRQLKEYFSGGSIKKAPSGDFIIEESFPYDEGLFKFILSFGNECEVIEPNYLREDIKNYLKKIIEKYNG